MPPPAAPTSTKEQVGAALQTAGQYAGGSTVWTPENAEELGLDPERGYIAKGTPTDQPQPTVEQVRQNLQQSGALPKPVTPTTHPGLHGFTNGEQAAPPPRSQQPGPVASPLPEPPPEPPVSVPTSVESNLKGLVSEEEHAQEEKKRKTATSQLEGLVSEEEHAKEGKPPPQLEGLVSEEEHAKEAAAPSIPQKSGETAPTPAPQPPTPMPSGTGEGAPQGISTALVPGRDAHINALIASGKTPGEAQAIADGYPPKTLNGQAPQPRPKQPPDIGTLAGEQAYVTGTPVSGIKQQPQPPDIGTLAGEQAYVTGAPVSGIERQATEATKPTEAPTTPKPAPADTTGVADFFRKRGDQPITTSKDPRLTTVSAGGQTWQVNKEAAPAFQGFVSELASKGAPITLGTGGGWAYRQKVGAKGISEHAFGGAIDVNQLPGQRGKITPEFQKWIAANPGVLQQIEKHWNIYGGERFGDLGHFEWGGVPISTTKTAATTGAAAQPAALGPDDAQVAAQLDKNLGGLLAGKGSVYVAMGKKYGVDPRLLAAISMEETGNGTSHLLRTRNNVGGITGKGHSGVGGDYMPYSSIEEGIEAEASLVRHGYIGQGLDTIDKIGAKWAPPGAANDPNQGNAGWPAAVRKFYAALGGTGKLGETSGEYPTFTGGDGEPGGPLAGQPLFSVPTADGGSHRPEGSPQQASVGGGGARGGGYAAEPSQGGGAFPDVVNVLGGIAGAAAALFRRPSQAPAEEEEPQPPSGGMKPANVLGVRTISPGPPPPAPSSLQAQLLAPPAAPGLPSPGGSAAAQAAMAPSLAPPKGPDPAVVKALMKRGFTRQQAEAFAAKATVSKPGAAAITGGTSFKPPAQPSGAPPAKQAPPAPALPAPSAKTAPPAKQAPQPRVATRIGPEGSTIGVPNPPGGPSPDDPRVKKQKDNLTKGEHFVPGDDSHDQLLSGLPGGHGGRQRQILGQAEQAIADKTPLHLSYISAPKEAAKFPTRESRTTQYDEHSPEARLMGTTEGQLVGHSLIPTAVGISPSRKTGEPHQGYIQGLSTNVMANNFQHILTKLAAMDRKSPYTKMGQKFANDLEGYLANLQAGHTGTGRGYAVGTEQYPSTPDESHVPYKLTRGEADFLNLVINNTGAFAKHEDGQALRELARANGTLINEKGETNRLRHQIEQHEPGWRERVLEPTIRSFKAGLIHEIHPTEEHMPESIRPGKEYHSLTEATARTSQRGRPDVPVAVSLHHTFTDNKRINEIERDFSDERINEAEARSRLKALGEDPDEYQFVGGSGGLITPYEENPEAITPEEHTELKTNLRKQWIGGKMPIEDYRRKAAEVPLPEKPSQPPASSPTAPETETVPSPKPITPVKPKPPKPQPEPEPEPATAEETPETPAPAPKPAAPRPAAPPAYKEAPSDPNAPTPAVKMGEKIFTAPSHYAAWVKSGKPRGRAQRPSEPEGTGAYTYGFQHPGGEFTLTRSREPTPKAPQEPPEAPEGPVAKTPEPAATPETPPAAPTAPVAAPKAPAKKAAKEPPPPRPISPETQKVLGPQPKNAKQAALWQQAGERLDTQVPEGIPLEVDRGDRGKFKTDPKGKVLYKKVGYDIANAPLLQKQGKALGQELNKKTGKMGMAKPPAETEDDLASLDPEKRLTPFLNPTDRKRVAHLNDVSAVDAYADELQKMYKGIEDLPEVMKGKNWYDEAVDLLRQHFGSHADMMANLLGATSAGNAVKINYNMALDAYHQFLRGHYDDAIKLYNQAYDIKQSGKGALMKHITDNGIHEALGEEAPETDEAAMAQWIAHHNLTPRAANGKLFGHNSIQVLKVLAHNWEEQAGGPKTPNFAANLNGRSMQATIDMWAARTMRRLGSEGHSDQPWMIQPAAETGVHNVDFGLSQLAFKKAADKIGIKPSALQAILWFAEQKEWQKRGWEREQDPDERDYRPMLKKYQRPGDITEAQAGKFHPSVPELEARLGGQGVLHMQEGGQVPDSAMRPDPAVVDPGPNYSAFPPNMGFFGYAGDASGDTASYKGIGFHPGVATPGSMVPFYSAGLTKEGAAMRGVKHPGDEFVAEDGKTYRWDDTAPKHQIVNGKPITIADNYIDVYAPFHPPDRGVSATKISQAQGIMRDAGIFKPGVPLGQAINSMAGWGPANQPPPTSTPLTTPTPPPPPAPPPPTPPPVPPPPVAPYVPAPAV